MLRFIWIKNYKNIHGQGFSFDSTFSFEYSSETGELRVESQPTSLSSRFFGPTVSHLTGVLGENGAGKTSLIEFIRLTLGSYSPGITYGLPSNLASIIIFDRYILHHHEIAISNAEALRGRGYNLSSYNEYLVSLGREDLGVFDEHIYVNYSNSLDISSSRRPNVIDVSTSYLFNESFPYVGQDRSDRDAYSPVVAYYTSEFISQIKLIHFANSRNAAKLPFGLPSSIYLRARPKSEVDFIEKLDHDFFQSNDIVNISDWARSLDWKFFRIKEENDVEEFITRFIRTKLLVLLKLYPRVFGVLSPSELYNLLYLNNDVEYINNGDLYKHLSALKTFVDFLRLANTENNIVSRKEDDSYRNEIVNGLVINIDKYNLNNVAKLFQDISQLNSWIQTFDVIWSGLSFGETAYLKLYARIYLALSRIEGIIEGEYRNVKTITILIDEAETGFHPQWQKEYMKLLLEFLDIVLENYKVQVIICSNSPFIASDIPKSNIILLHRDNVTANCEVQLWSWRQQTFAANIHTLLTDSFFLKEGLMGSFAKAKINTLIAYLQNKSLLKDDSLDTVDHRHMKEVLDMIGEPILKMKLQEMWDDRFGIEEQIASLEARITELRRKQQ